VESYPESQAGVREVIRIAIERKDTALQALLMASAAFKDSSNIGTKLDDWWDMRLLLERASLTGNAEGLKMLLATENAGDWEGNEHAAQRASLQWPT
jgi:hypothetical protein